MSMLTHQEIGRSRIPFLHLEPSDAKKLRPSSEVVRHVAQATTREEGRGAPGIIVIPDTSRLFPEAGSRRLRSVCAEIFQLRLMRAMLTYLKAELPQALTPQDYLALPEEVAQREYRKAKPGVAVLSVDGRTSYKPPHMDSLQHLVVSLCYHPRRNIVGGTPLFLDLLLAFPGRSAANVTHLVPGKAIYHPKERAALLRPNFLERARNERILIRGLDWEKFPIVIASNRVADGIMHGATPVRRIDQSRRWSRPISYVAIKCN